MLVWVRCFYITAYAIKQKPVLFTDKFVFKTESGTFYILSANPTCYEYILPKVFRTEIIDRHQEATKNSTNIANKTA